MIKRCVSWWGVSSVAQADRSSPDDQREDNLEFIQNLSHYYPGYEGVLVANLGVAHSRDVDSLEEAARKMPEYAELRRMITEKAFDLLICRSRDRLGRTDVLQLQIERTCLRNGIIVVPRRSNRPPTLDIYELQKNEGYSFLRAIDSAWSDAEIRRLVGRARDGLDTMVQDEGRFPGRLNWGYSYDFLLENGKPVLRDGKLVRIVKLDPEVKNILREVFLDLYLAGHGAESIRQHMVDRGARAPWGGEWTKNTLSVLLRNTDIYAGYVRINKNSKTGRSLILAKGSHEPVFTEEEASRIKDEKQRRSYTRRVRTRLFSGCTLCGHCGELMSGTSKRHFGVRKDAMYLSMRCGNPNCTARPSIRDRLLLDAVRDTVAALQQRTGDLSELVQSQSGAKSVLLRQQIDECSGLLDRNAVQRKRLLDIYLDEKITRSDFEQKLEQITTAAQRLSSKMQALQEELSKVTHEDQLLERIRAVRERGVKYIDSLASSDPVQLSAWLKEHFRIFVYAASGLSPKRRVRIDFV